MLYRTHYRAYRGDDLHTVVKSLKRLARNVIE
ncbi:hypothetical protein NIES4075_40510 [Tolypothrix sp. NIES-4075]|nr:hypothetical protein NIES4075_40510 [Tolypothrix sp. NIES-4075]